MINRTNLRLLFAIALCRSFAAAQTVGEIKTIKVEYATPAERTSTVLAKGHLVADDADPSLLYIGDGLTEGGVLVTPATGTWDHSATKDILLNGHRLQLGAGYSLITVGAYAAVSGQGEIQTDAGTAAWSINASPMIRVSGENLLVNIDSLAWDNDNQQFVLILNVGANTNPPTIEGASDLVLGDWAEITEGVTIGAYAAGYRTVTIDYDAEWDVLFFRAVLDAAGFANIELLANTEITGNLTVSGTIPRSADIDLGVAAHGWGDHAAAGYLTTLPATATQAEAEAGTLTDLRSWTPERVKQAILELSPPTPSIQDYRLGFFPTPVANDQDWLLMSRAGIVDDADPGNAYAMVTATASTTFDIYHNATDVGDVVFAIGSNTGTVTLTQDIDYAAGDRIRLVAGATPDATLGDIQLVLKGVLD